MGIADHDVDWLCFLARVLPSMAGSKMSKYSQWDHPIFKVLRSDEIGSAKGHQSGFRVPVELRKYMPVLPGEPTSSVPTIAVPLAAELYLNGEHKFSVLTNYRIQTWGGTRRGETRITGNLMELLSLAKENDVMVISRRKGEVDIYRLELINRGGPVFRKAAGLIAGRSWGVLDIQHIPLSLADEYNTAVEAEIIREMLPFKLFDIGKKTSVSSETKISRSKAFRKRVLQHYDYKCVLCNSGMKSAGEASELDAAHIVPRSVLGVDDVRNGLALCKPHHWAFDLGLWCVDAEQNVKVAKNSAQISENRNLVVRDGQRLDEFCGNKLVAHPDALAWHRKSRFSDNN